MARFKGKTQKPNIYLLGLPAVLLITAGILEYTGHLNVLPNFSRTVEVITPQPDREYQTLEFNKQAI